ncbi:MAG TPA: divergent polysaccharide deacetylase family protein, partial [Thermodesulfobacteriota bacterium]|nr:divergent polysaccharide deacetylase family protein [Thermodesulfobacteriota bacterium]
MGRSKKKGARKKSRKWVIPGILIAVLASAAILFFLFRPAPTQKITAKLPPPPAPAPAGETHEKKPEKKEITKKEKEAEPARARLAFIIDDAGYSLDKVKTLLDIGIPITFSILPDSPQARKVALLAHEKGEEIMLHLPMEPKGGDRLPLEKETVLAGMDKKQVQAILRRDLALVPHVRGVNNHMGSKATEDAGVMQAVMEVLKEQGLYFVDSQTSSRTAGPQSARKAGVPFASNDHFIDQEKDLERMKNEIRRAMKKAKQDGKVVVIAH